MPIPWAWLASDPPPPEIDPHPSKSYASSVPVDLDSDGSMDLAIAQVENPWACGEQWAALVLHLFLGDGEGGLAHLDSRVLTTDPELVRVGSGDPWIRVVPDQSGDEIEDLYLQLGSTGLVVSSR